MGMFDSFGGGGGAKLNQSMQDIAAARRSKQNQIIDETKGPLSYFYGSDPTKSGLYKDFMTTGTESTARAYDDAKANVRTKGLMSGFGETSPIENGAEAGLSNEESKAMADVPNQALKSTIAPELQALSTRSGQAGYYSDAPQYAGVGANAQNQQNAQNSQAASAAMQAAMMALMMA